MLVSVYPVLSQLTDGDAMVTPDHHQLEHQQTFLIVCELGGNSQRRKDTDISVRAKHKIQNIFSIKKCCNLKNYVNKMKPIIFNQFGNCCNFSWEHWSILIIWWLVRSRKLVCDLDQSSRRNVKTGYFREDGSRFLEIAAVHVASVKVRHLPVNPGHLSTSTGMESEENEISSSYLCLEYLLVQSSVGVEVMWGSFRPMKTVAVSVVCKPSINSILSSDNSSFSLTWSCRTFQ